jgi:hypothetical protein
VSDEVCGRCGFHVSAHSDNCPRVFAPLPQPTAYERDQQALRDRVERIDTLRRDWELESEHRINAALRRVEQLELEVARLTAPREPVPEPPAIYLPCGCWNDVHGCRGHNASPATAYPPLPDEGT